MAANTTTATALQFKSHKGGEYRAQTEDTLYRARKIEDGVWTAERATLQVHGGKAMPASAWETLGSAADRQGAQMVADQIATNPVIEAPAMVQATGDGPELAEVLESVQDVDTTAELAQAAAQGAIDANEAADVAALVAQTDAAASKTAAKVAAKADAAAKKAAKAAATREAKAGQPAPAPVGQLQFEAFRGDEDDQRAKGGKRTYRVQHGQAGGFYAAQRGTGGWTPIAGKCATQAEAIDLCQRYEDGAPQLSHRQFQGMPYSLAIEALAK